MSDEDFVRAEISETRVRELELEVENLRRQVADYRALYGPLERKRRFESPADATADLLREFASGFTRKDPRHFGILLVAKGCQEGKPSVVGYVSQAPGLLPEHIKAALDCPFEVVVIGEDE